MRVALKGVPVENLPRPGGLVSIRVNKRNGKLADSSDTEAVFEVVPSDRIPEPDDSALPGEEESRSGLEDLF